MIKSLRIHNFALIDELEVNFTSGLNIIIGETGSGKSMLIDSLILLLGDRASSDFVRTGEKKAVIEAEIDVTDNKQLSDLLLENGFEFVIDNTLLLRREISSKGSSRNFINDTPANLNMLKSIGEILIDFHGQHDHQSLLKTEKHIKIFDAINKKEHLIGEFIKLKGELIENVNNYTHLIKQENELKAERDMLEFKLDEILKVDPHPDEDVKLESELVVLENAEQIIIQCNECYNLLFDSQTGAQSILSSVFKTIQSLSKYDNEFEQYAAEINSAQIVTKETSSFLLNYINNLEFNPEKIERIRTRLFEIKNLIRKYGSLTQIIELRDIIKSKLAESENFDVSINDLMNKINELKGKLSILGLQISRQRVNESKTFSSQIENKLMQMGIPNADFKVLIRQKAASEDDLVSVNIDGRNHKIYEDGIDELEFHISTNMGEMPTSLINVASGGEVSRIMLGLKSILAGNDNIPIMVFDEIDTGISGRIAQKVGNVMKELAQYHQILAVTHLPQIAALGDTIISVRKFEDESRTWVEADILDDDGRINEIAKMLSGETITVSAIESAKILINKTV